VFGIEPHISADNVFVIRNAEDNIGKNLLQNFDDESDDEAEGGKVLEGEGVSNKPDPPMPSMA
jgi:hypothetical protein